MSTLQVKRSRSGVRKLSIIFDNGGGITLQTPTFCHYYAHAKHAAVDVCTLLEIGYNSSWDGNEPQHRLTFPPAQSGYTWYDLPDFLAVIKRGSVNTCGCTEQVFWQQFGVAVND